MSKKSIKQLYKFKVWVFLIKLIFNFEASQFLGLQNDEISTRKYVFA